MSVGTFVQLNCRPAQDIQVGTKIVQGLLISPDDRAHLMTLDADVTISLACPGRRTVYARPQTLLRRMVQVPYADDWYVSVTGTGPLYESKK